MKKWNNGTYQNKSNVEKEKIIAALDDCLLKEEDVLKGRSYWDTLEDPFPAWK